MSSHLELQQKRKGAGKKKGVSILIGYVLLIVFAVVIGAIVYQWLKTYVPAESLNCPEGTALFISGASYCGNQLNLSIKNNGRFDIAGYFIHASNTTSSDVATLDLTPYFNNVSGKIYGSSILLSSTDINNTFSPSQTISNTFNLPSSLGTLSSIELIPTRFQIVSNRNRFVSCSDAKIQQASLTCNPSGPTCPDTCSSLGFQCGTQTVCGASTNCGSCSGGNICNATGKCVAPGPMAVFWDGFENSDGYTAITNLSNPPLYPQMMAKGWTVVDINNGDTNDDIYRNNTIEYQGTYSIVVKDTSNITANISTLGYHGTTLAYARRTSATSASNRLIISWRIGNSGSWNQLESMRNDGAWATTSFPLSGADNQNLIQVRFYMNGGNANYGLIDNVNVSGTPN